MKPSTFLALIAATLLATASPSPADAQDSGEAHSSGPLRVVTTMPDLAYLARAVGGERVLTTTITKGPEDPHFSQPKPSFILALSEADALIQVGMELEVGYVPVLLRGARNSRVLPGAAGAIDASTAIEPLEIPGTPVDRSMGDVHALGNPHFLLDPINGLRVANLIRERFTALRPAEADHFDRGYAEFRRRIAEALVGEALAAKYDIEPLMRLADLGRLDAFLEEQGDLGDLGGWLARLRPFAGTQVVSEHRLWPYFARRFGLKLFGEMEPVPGVPPTTRHLQTLVERMRGSSVPIIVTAPYYDSRHARFLAEATGATVVHMVHQVGGLAGVDDYVGMIDYNVRQLAVALESRR